MTFPLASADAAEAEAAAPARAKQTKTIRNTVRSTREVGLGLTVPPLRAGAGRAEGAGRGHPADARPARGQPHVDGLRVRHRRLRRGWRRSAAHPGSRL